MKVGTASGHCKFVRIGQIHVIPCQANCRALTGKGRPQKVQVLSLHLLKVLQNPAPQYSQSGQGGIKSDKIEV